MAIEIADSDEDDASPQPLSPRPASPAAGAGQFRLTHSPAPHDDEIRKSWNPADAGSSAARNHAESSRSNVRRAPSKAINPLLSEVSDASDELDLIPRTAAMRPKVSFDGSLAYPVY